MQKLDSVQSRRHFLGTSGVLAASILVGRAQEKQCWDSESGVTAPEDLMREHGVLDRYLLVYEEGLRRLQSGGAVEPALFQRTAQHIRRFVEDYHERNEEQFIFPIFQRAHKLESLVSTLRTQHDAGRAVTSRILELTQGSSLSSENRNKVAEACRSYIRMYRPHAAREETVLFPTLRTILRPDQVLRLGDNLGKQEKRVLGKGGFEKAVHEAAVLQEQFGIFDLEQFTPRIAAPAATT